MVTVGQDQAPSDEVGMLVETRKARDDAGSWVKSLMMWAVYIWAKNRH